MAHKLFLFLNLAILSIPAQALAEWKWRAREHFEVHTLKHQGSEVNYRGLSNTINYWHEKPFDYALGFAFGPLIGSAKSEGSNIRTEFGNKIILSSLGIEYKKWVSAELPLFLRLGLFHESLNGEGTLGDLSGTGYLVGFGYEYIYKGVGIAIEITQRKSSLGSGVEVDSFTPSIGFHFYPFL